MSRLFALLTVGLLALLGVAVTAPAPVAAQSTAELQAMHRRVVTQGGRSLSVSEGVRLFKLVEEQYPSWSATQVTDALRKVCHYDTEHWRTLVGATAPGQTIRAGSKLTTMDVEQLTLLLSRSGDESYGIATDPGGRRINFAHVVAGVAVGHRRLRNVALSGFNHVGIGSKMDNMYAGTLAGDVGQSAVLTRYGRTTARVGPNSDLSIEELVADIDGQLIAMHLTALGEVSRRIDAKISTVVHNYYFTTKVPTANFRNRAHLAAYEIDWPKTHSEANKFADNYKYKISKTNFGDDLSRDVLDTYNEAKVELARLAPLTAGELATVKRQYISTRRTGLFIHRVSGTHDTLYRKRGAAWQVSFDNGTHWQGVGQQRLSYDFGGVAGNRVPALCNLRLMAYLHRNPSTRLN